MSDAPLFDDTTSIRLRRGLLALGWGWWAFNLAWTAIGLWLLSAIWYAAFGAYSLVAPQRWWALLALIPWAAIFGLVIAAFIQVLCRGGDEMYLQPVRSDRSLGIGRWAGAVS